MPRFFYPEKISEEAENLKIYEEQMHHMRDVLRIKPGEEIDISDGFGTELICEVAFYYKEYVLLNVISKKESWNEPSYKAVLYQGLVKSDKIELVIQKAVELGVSKIVPVICKRSVAKFKDESDISKKVSRWNKIAMEAAKQSGRGIIPQVEFPLKLKDAFEKIKNSDYAFIPWESEEDILIKEILSKSKNHENPEISFIIGPEGGFSMEEIKQAKEHGIPTVTLGKRILRTETAGLSVLSMILYELEL